MRIAERRGEFSVTMIRTNLFPLSDYLNNLLLELDDPAEIRAAIELLGRQVNESWARWASATIEELKKREEELENKNESPENGKTDQKN